jgi:hypothetical protein
MSPSPSLGPPWLSESPSPAFAPWGIPEEALPEELLPEEVPEDALPEDLLDDLCDEEVCDGAVFALAAEVVRLWLWLDPQPAATSATMRAAPAASRRRTVMRCEIIFCSFRDHPASSKDAPRGLLFPALVPHSTLVRHLTFAPNAVLCVTRDGALVLSRFLGARIGEHGRLLGDPGSNRRQLVG